MLVALGAVAGPLLAAAIGRHRLVAGDFVFAHGGAAFTLMLLGALLLPVAAFVLAKTDDRAGVPLRRDLREALRGDEPAVGPAATGFFLALEGGDGAGKSTQVEALADWIRSKGHEVVVTREPGATPIGKRLRSILLDVSSAGLSNRAEALLYAADRAEHVDSVVRPALERGAIVISDRYIDSSVAYQGAGRDLAPTEIARISRWATSGLVPHLTVLLDVDPATARERFTEAPDRLESEPAEFHERVRSGFLTLAAADPTRYLVVDAGQEPESITTVVRHRLDQLLPLSEAEIEAIEEARRKAEEEARRKAEEEAARKAEEERLEKERRSSSPGCAPRRRSASSASWRKPPPRGRTPGGGGPAARRGGPPPRRGGPAPAGGRGAGPCGRAGAAAPEGRGGGPAAPGGRGAAAGEAAQGRRGPAARRGGPPPGGGRGGRPYGGGAGRGRARGGGAGVAFPVRIPVRIRVRRRPRAPRARRGRRCRRTRSSVPTPIVNPNEITQPVPAARPEDEGPSGSGAAGSGRSGSGSGSGPGDDETAMLPRYTDQRSTGSAGQAGSRQPGTPTRRPCSLPVRDDQPSDRVPLGLLPGREPGALARGERERAHP